MEDLHATARQQVYECSVCGYLYDPSVGDPENGIPAGTPFNELPAEWVCPICGVNRDLFDKVESSDSQPAARPANLVKEYQNNDIIVYWYPRDCSHAGKCLAELPGVFDMNKKPWINLSGFAAEEIISTIDKCPTRALQYSLPEGSSVDPKIARGPGSRDYKINLAAAGKIRAIKDGPLLVEGPNRVFDSSGNLIREADRLVLCCCGRTGNPPFCDGSHIPGRHL